MPVLVAAALAGLESGVRQPLALERVYLECFLSLVSNHSLIPSGKTVRNTVSSSGRLFLYRLRVRLWRSAGVSEKVAISIATSSMSKSPRS